MLTRYRRHFHHDRRRIIFAAALNILAGHFGSGLLPDPLSVPTEVLVVAGFLVLIPVFTSKYRARRHWVEIIAIGNVIVTLSGDLDPGGFFGWHGVMFMLTLQIPAFAGLLIGLRSLIYGHWSDRFAPRRRYVVTTTLHSCLPKEELWYGMVPTPGFADRNPDREVVSIEFADASKTTVRLVTWVPPFVGAGEVLIAFDDLITFQYARFRMRVVKGVYDPGAQGETELVIEDKGARRVLRMRHKVNGFTPRRAILGYFDDTFGRLMAARLEAIEARAASGAPTKTTTSFNSWFEAAGGMETATDDGLAGYRTAYGRRRSDDETKALQALGRI